MPNNGNIAAQATVNGGAMQRSHPSPAASPPLGCVCGSHNEFLVWNQCTAAQSNQNATTHTHMDGMLQLAGLLAPHARTKWWTLNKMQELFLLLFSCCPSLSAIFFFWRAAFTVKWSAYFTPARRNKKQIKIVYAKHVYEIYLIILLPCSQISRKRQALQGIRK